jgi:SulP family sulfate permease
MSERSFWYKLIPALQWMPNYNKAFFKADFVAGIVVTIMLIPQSLAYAMLAGMPPETGLYASILPLIVYALFGTSKTLSVGPVAIVSLMTMAALADIAETQSADYVSAAITLALLSGLFLLALGLLKFGFVAHFLSHTVVSGFITASGLIIAFSQLRHLLGVDASGHNLYELLINITQQVHNSNSVTVLISLCVLALLFWSRQYAVKSFTRLEISSTNASLFSKAMPVFCIALSIAVVAGFDLSAHGVAIVGSIPSGLPQLKLPSISWNLIEQLWLPALTISLIGYVESVSVGKTLAAKRRERIDSNQELIGLGASNIASSFSGGFPVTGGLSRSIVNYDAGAVTPAAGIYAAIGIAIASLFLAPAIYFLPKTTLAATIVIAVLSLIDTSILSKTWRYSKSDFYAVAATILGTLALGVEVGVAIGISLSLILHLYRTSVPHIAEIGLIEGAQHFRNIHRFKTVTQAEILSLRIDESLFFANAHSLEDVIYKRIYEQGDIAHVILLCNAVNEIDFTALEVLSDINQRLSDQGIVFHLSEIKGPVMDALNRSGFISSLSGKVFLTHYDAYSELSQSIAHLSGSQ